MSWVAAIVATGGIGLSATGLLIVRSNRAERRRAQRREKRLAHDAEALRHWQALQQSLDADGFH